MTLPTRCPGPRPRASYRVAFRPDRERRLRAATATAAAVFVFEGSAPSKDRTCDLGFRKTNKTRGVVFPYDSRNAQLSNNSLRLRGAIAKSRFHAIAINQLDRAAQVVRIEIGVALRSREVRVPRELLDGRGPCPVPEELRHEEVA